MKVRKHRYTRQLLRRNLELKIVSYESMNLVHTGPLYRCCFISMINFSSDSDRIFPAQSRSSHRAKMLNEKEMRAIYEGNNLDRNSYPDSPSAWEICTFLSDINTPLKQLVI